MANRRMTAIEKEHFLKQVERKGKALALPDAERAKWQKEYDKILDYIREHYKNFLLSSIIRNDRYRNKAVLEKVLEQEKDNLGALIGQALREGNAEDLSWCCWLMHLKYMLMWREWFNALQQEG